MFWFYCRYAISIRHIINTCVNEIIEVISNRANIVIALFIVLFLIFYFYIAQTMTNKTISMHESNHKAIIVLH